MYAKLYPSIIDLAQSRGSSAQTKSGAKKFLLAHMPAPIPGLIAIDGRAQKRRDVGKLNYIQICKNRLERGADTCAKNHGLQSRGEWVIDQTEAGNITAAFEQSRNAQAIAKSRADYAAYIYSRAVPFSSVSMIAADWKTADPIFTIGGRIIVLSSHEDCTWAKNRHYPTSKTITRYAELLPVDFDDCSARAALTVSTAKTARIEYSARGNWLQKLAIELLALPEIKVAKNLKCVQIEAHHEIKLVRKLCGVEFYVRTLAGEFVDYVAFARGVAFHADTKKSALAGLIAKLAQPGSRHERLNFKIARSLGFCTAGITQFCDDVGIDVDGDYSRAQIRAAISGKDVSRYSTELVTAGI